MIRHRHGFGWQAGKPARRWLAAVLAAALAVTGMQAAGAARAFASVASQAATSGPVSNAFAMGGGIGGSIDQRTGAFQASIPLVNIAGRADAGLSLALSYSQSLAAQGIDRFGFGAGWSLGVPWVDTAGGVHVYPASGGAYAYNSLSPTGLAEYPLRDLLFEKKLGTIEARPGLPGGQQYAYTLANLNDGTTDRFDASGNLVEQLDRYGNSIDITWQHNGPWWRPTSVVDSYGQVTTFSYAPGRVSMTAPVNAEKIAATTTLTLDRGRLVSVTDPLGQRTTLDYSPVPNMPDPLLSSVVSPTGEHTGISYTDLAYEPQVAMVKTVSVTDAEHQKVLTDLKFNGDPTGNNRHNYTGYPNHVASGSDGLFSSGDFGYRYSTELSNGSSAVTSTYDSLHLLVVQKIYTHDPAGSPVLSQAQAYAYPPVTSVAKLPPSYSMPTEVKVIYGDPAYGDTRTVVTKASYNDRGLLESATNAAGMVTTDTYFPNGLLDTETETGPRGATSITKDTLTADGKSIRTVTTAVGPSAATATARTVATYDYNQFGQVTGDSLTWAPGAKPPGNSGGPNTVDDTEQISVNPRDHTQTDTVTAAAGTPQAATTTTVTDLVTGNVLSQTNPDHLTTSYTYDALGRELTQTAPGGLTTSTVYNSPTETTVTDPNGLETQTTTDVLGRTVKVTDNVSGQKLVANPAARTLETDTYNPAGTELTTTTPAGTTTTTLDGLGRPTKIVQPGGITENDSYNDVNNTQTVQLLAAGATSPTSVTTNGFSNLNQQTSSASSYPDGTPSAPSAETYDGLGRVSSFTADNLTASVSYDGAGGLQTATALTPDAPKAFPGPAVSAVTGNTMTGTMTAKTLTEQATAGPATAIPAAASATGSTYTYNDAGHVATVTDQAEKTTRYTYTPAGQIATVTTPSGTVTTFSFDKVTGRLVREDVRAADGATQDTAYTYYDHTGLVKSVYDPADPADAISYDYDADGHLTAVHYPGGKTTTATYDDNGNLATSTDITGAVTRYTYNADGNCGPVVTDLCKAAQTRDGTMLASVSYTYDHLDRLHTLTRGNMVTTTLTYNDASQIATETTTAASGSLLRRDDYTYDSHGNIATHTITSALPAPATPGHALARAAATPVTAITAYGYDAYNRLTSSAVYPGEKATGTPTTRTSYAVNVAGDVTQLDTTAGGTSTKITNTIDGGRLTTRDINGTITHQDFDADGNVTKDLAGSSYTFNPAGQIASVTTLAGVRTAYSYWPDGSRRAATTTVNGVQHTVTFYYSTTGEIANDSYAGGGPEVTASYLMAVSREARTLTTGGAAAQTSGPGTGYYLTDAHTSVDAMIDGHGQITASYSYTDYGQPIGANPAVLPAPAADPAANAAVNPFTYDAAYTNPATGTQYLPARTYDPAQGRFLSLDAADQINRYQAFNTNPILNTDPTGQEGFPQWLTDGAAAALFITLGVISLFTGVGTLLTAAGIVGAAAAGAEITATAVGAAILETISGAANVGAAVTSSALFADDVKSLDGEGFFDQSTRMQWETANYALGTVAGITDFAAKGVDIVVENDAQLAQATALSESYRKGYQAGNTTGFVEGFESGYSLGETAGYPAGYTAGKAESSLTGQKLMFEAGFGEGYASGEAQGYRSGFQQGYGEGYGEGHDTGWKTGYSLGTRSPAEMTPLESATGAIPNPGQGMQNIAAQNEEMVPITGSGSLTTTGQEPFSGTGTVAGEATVNVQANNMPTSLPQTPNVTGQDVPSSVLSDNSFNVGFYGD